MSTPVNAEGQVEGDRRLPTKGERQRQSILDALTQLLAARPIHELSVAEIADGAGTRRSNFYFYFDTKYTALAVLTSEIWSELMDQAQSFVRFDGESVGDFLARTASITVETWHRNQAVLISSIQAIPLDSKIANMWSRWNGRLSQIIAEQVIRDQASDQARPVATDVDRLIATLLEMTLHVFYQDCLNNNDAGETAMMLETVRAIWLASAWGLNPLSAT